MKQSLPSKVTHFRRARPGPEAAIQTALLRRIPGIFRMNSGSSWTGASVPLGAGVPDLVVVSYDPQVSALARLDQPDAQTIAYLRRVGRARFETIARRTGASASEVEQRLMGLIDAGVVLAGTPKTFHLSPRWREILPEVITIEVKVTDWRRAVVQAARNRIFAHRSYVALPSDVAARVRSQPIFRQLGLGLLSVSSESGVAIIRKGRRSRPIVWAYYYRLASMLARSFPA